MLRFLSLSSKHLTSIHIEVFVTDCKTFSKHSLSTKLPETSVLVHVWKNTCLRQTMLKSCKLQDFDTTMDIMDVSNVAAIVLVFFCTNS